MKIRKANKKDLATIVELSLGMLPYHIKFSNYYKPIEDKAKWKKLTIKYFRKLMKGRNSRFFVAEENGKIIGYTVGNIKKSPPVLKEKYNGEFGEVYISKEYRGRGIAGKLIKEMLIWFKKRKMSRVFLRVDVHNESAKKAYKKAGFRPFQDQYQVILK